MATGNLQRIATQAWEAFSRFRSGLVDSSRLSQNLNHVLESVSKMTAADLNIDTKNLPSYTPWAAPSGYMDICEDGVMTMGVFTLRKTGIKIPLHDHPGMYGILKVLYGRVRIRSFSRVEHREQTPAKFIGLTSTPLESALTPAHLASDSLLDSQSDAIVLTPEIGNMHSIEAVDGPAAFLDILSPPYDPPGRDCQYYRELQAEGQESGLKDLRWLLHTPQPKEFHCELEHYPGPNVTIGTL